MLIKELMQEDVVTVPSDLPLAEVADLFRKRGISGAPVVDDAGIVLGVISQTDLMLAPGAPPAPVARFHVEPEPLEGGVGVVLTRVEGAAADSVMTPGAIAVDENTPVAEVAKAMLERHIHRMLVTRAGKLAGIVSTMDLLRVVAGLKRPPARKAPAKKTAARRHGKSAK
jgi:CBS domain-containing protein